MWLRMLLGAWIKQQAGEQVKEAVRRAATQAADNPEQPPSASQATPDGQSAATESESPEHPPCDVAVIFALGIESGGLQDKLSGLLTTRAPRFVVRQGGHDGRRIVIVESGIGCPAAEEATKAVISGHQPKWVISAGFAGGLNDNLKAGDFLLCDSVTRTQNEMICLDLRVDAQSFAARKGMHVGRLLTVDQIISQAEEKRALGESHTAVAVDMETWSVAATCRAAGVPFLAVRIISDTVDETLPADIERLVSKQTTAGRLGAVAGAVVRRPSSIKDMLRLKERALVLSDRLATFLISMIDQLPRR